MKTHIVQIQPDDDWRSAAARLPRAAGDRVVLVWPEQDGPQPLGAALRLIGRQAQRWGLELALAARRRALIRAAKDLDIPIFAEAQEAGRAPWQTGEGVKVEAARQSHSAAELRAQATERRLVPQPARLTVRLAWFALGVLAFLLSAVLLLGLPV